MSDQFKLPKNISKFFDNESIRNRIDTFKQRTETKLGNIRIIGSYVKDDIILKNLPENLKEFINKVTRVSTLFKNTQTEELPKNHESKSEHTYKADYKGVLSPNAFKDKTSNAQPTKDYAPPESFENTQKRQVAHEYAPPRKLDSDAIQAPQDYSFPEKFENTQAQEYAPPQGFAPQATDYKPIETERPAHYGPITTPTKNTVSEEPAPKSRSNSLTLTSSKAQLFIGKHETIGRGASKTVSKQAIKGKDIKKLFIEEKDVPKKEKRSSLDLDNIKKSLIKEAKGVIDIASRKLLSKQGTVDIALQKINKDEDVEREVSAMELSKKLKRVPKFFGVLKIGEFHHIVTQLANKGDFKSYLSQERSSVDKDRLARQTLKLLVDSQKAGIAHHDWSEDNILVNVVGKKPKLLLSDFGLATEGKAQLGMTLHRQTVAPPDIPFQTDDKGRDALWSDPSYDAWGAGLMLLNIYAGVSEMDLPWAKASNGIHGLLLKAIVSGTVKYDDDEGFSVAGNAPAGLKALLVNHSESIPKDLLNQAVTIYDNISEDHQEIIMSLLRFNAEDRASGAQALKQLNQLTK